MKVYGKKSSQTIPFDLDQMTLKMVRKIDESKSAHFFFRDSTRIRTKPSWLQKNWCSVPDEPLLRVLLIKVNIYQLHYLSIFINYVYLPIYQTYYTPKIINGII